MNIMNDRIIFHVDVNSAYLSWESVYRLQHGSSTDLREIPSAVGGDIESRHGIILAKSIPAKKYKIQTGETLFTARQKCPELVIVPPRYDLYIRCSNALVDLLKKFTPRIQRYSIDECFLDFTGMGNLFPSYEKLGDTIRQQVKEELGFTVSVGISSNKLLAKMASDLKKPDFTTTLFPIEISEKMWHLPVEDLFMVGRATASKLHRLNINTIGDLANCSPDTLSNKLKSHGITIWKYANGIENSEVRKSNFIDMKGIGNSTTIPFDVSDRATAHSVLLSLAETVGMRLRDAQNCCRLVAVGIKTNALVSYSRQNKLLYSTDSTNKIAEISCRLFDEVWKGEPIRHLGVWVSELCTDEFNQASFFEDKNSQRLKALDNTVDAIRMKYGSTSVIRAVFVGSSLNPLSGGIGDSSYPVMSSIL